MDKRVYLRKEYAGKVDGEPCAEFLNTEDIERSYVSCHLLEDTPWPDCELKDIEWRIREEGDQTYIRAMYEGEEIKEYPVHLQEYNPMKELRKEKTS